MSTALTMTENATPIIRATARRATSRGAGVAVGIGMRDVVRKWLGDLDQNYPTKHSRDLPGSVPTHYYEQAAQSLTLPAVVGNQVSFSITQVGFRQRLLGGEITPKVGKYLTLPAQAAAYGKTARESGELAFVFVMDTDGYFRPALVPEELIQRRLITKGIGTKGLTAADVMFWLVKKVSQDPDPSVLPGEEYITFGAVQGLRDYMQRIPKEGEAE